MQAEILLPAWLRARGVCNKMMAGPPLPGSLDEAQEEISVLVRGERAGLAAAPASPGSSLRTAGAAVMLAMTKGDRSFEAVHRGRYLPDQARDEWQRHRADALSGDRLKPWTFAKASLYELFPGFISVWLILALEGGNHSVAANRNLTPFKKFPLGIGTAFGDLLLLAAPYASFVLWLYYRRLVWTLGRLGSRFASQ